MLTRLSFRASWIAATAAVVLAFGPAPDAAAQVPTPESAFGFRVGTDGRIADWPALLHYFDTVDTASDRVKVTEVGTTTEGRRLIAAFISSPANLDRLEAIKAANRRLADPRRLGEAEASRLGADQPVVVAVGCSIHGTELAATQMAADLLHELATADDARTAAILDQVVLLLFPSLNPDGHAVVTEWVEKTRGTPFEGGPIPWLYHKYAGHDINRDAFMLNLRENRLLARFFYGEWHPQVFLSLHQMGQFGARFFVPPNDDPIDPNYDPLIWREAALLGSAMALELEAKGRAGVLSNAMYDYYWPGYEDSAPLGHNTVCLLTEAASARLASPIEVPASKLTGTPRGLPVYGPQTTFPNPWPGGTWRLRDIVDYELDAVRGLLGAAARYRRELVDGFYQMGRRAVARGRQESPAAFVIPTGQHDPSAAARLVGLLLDNGVEVHEASEDLRAGDRTYPKGTRVVLMGQPFRAFAKTLLEPQAYPTRRVSPQAPPERPYDVAGWTLPFQMGVKVDRVDQAIGPAGLRRLAAPAAPAPGTVGGEARPAWFVLDARGTGGTLAANRLIKAGASPAWTTETLDVGGYQYPPGSIVVGSSGNAAALVGELTRELGLRADGMRGNRPASAVAIGSPRVGLYKAWTASIDEGWNRWLLERYEFAFRSLTDAEVRKGGLADAFDVIVLPDMTSEQILGGHKASEVPAEFAGGIGPEGAAAIAAFVEAGGTLVCLDSSSAFAIETLKLPVRDALRGLKPEQFFCPGSLLRTVVATDHPIGYGLEGEVGAFFAFGSAFEILPSVPEDGTSASVVTRYAERDVLMSGWLEGEAALAGRAAVVDVRRGLGRVVLIGFRAQHRGQSLGTFRLLFNAIHGTPAGAGRGQ